MRLKPKTVRRLILLAAVVILVGGSVASVFVLRSWQTQRTASRARARGMEQVAQGRYFEALDSLNTYLRRVAVDREALLAYAKAREEVEEHNGRHIAEAVNFYRQCYAMDSTDRSLGVHIAELYNKIGYNEDSRDWARRFRPDDLSLATKEHLDAIRIEVMASAAVGRKDDTYARLLDRAVDLDPGDIRMQIAHIAYLRDNKRRDEAIAHAATVETRLPGDKRVALLRAIARGVADEAGAAQFLADLCLSTGVDAASGQVVAPAPYSDGDFILRAVGYFDSLRKPEHALNLLQAAAGSPGAPLDVVRAYVRRAWQAGLGQDLEAVPPDAKVHADLLAFRALALVEAGKGAAAESVISALAGRAGDFRAQAWAKVLRAAVKPPASATVDELNSGIQSWPIEPAFYWILANHLGALHRDEEAVVAWRQAAEAPGSAGWPDPWSAIAETMLRQGRLDEAKKAADKALLAWPRSARAAAAVLAVRSASMRSAGVLASDLESQLKQVDKAIESLSGARSQPAVQSLLASLIPQRALLLARLARVDEARSVIRSVLAESGWNSEVLVRLAEVSAKERLALEWECMTAAETVAGLTPEIAEIKSRLLGRAGRFEEIREAIAQAAAKPGPDRARWSVVLARALEGAGNPGAVQAWTAVASTFPDDLDALCAVLRSDAAAADLALIERTIARVGQLSGSDASRPPILCRVAKARALVKGAVSIRARDEAVALLRAVVAEAPDLVEPRLLLAQALLLESPKEGVSPDVRSGVEQVRAAAELTGSKARGSIEVARVLRDRADFVGAKAELIAAANDGAAPDSDRFEAVDLLLSQRDTDAAIPPLEDLVKHRPDPQMSSSLKLAGAYVTLRRDREAAELLGRIIEGPGVPMRVVADAAIQLTHIGQGQIAAQALPKLTGETSHALMHRARVLNATGDASGAKEYFARSVAAADADSESWVAYITFLTSAGERAAAKDAAEAGARAFPLAPSLQGLRAALTDGDGIASLASSLADGPAANGLSEVVAAVVHARDSGQLKTTVGILALADRFPDIAAVQVLAARLLLERTPPSSGEALIVAERALARFPTSVDAAKLAVRAARGLGEWARMLQAAQAWRSLDRDRAADVAVAEARVAVGQADSAMASIAGLVPGTVAELARPLALPALAVHVRALAQLGRAEDAWMLVAPLAAASQEVRLGVMIPAGASWISDRTRAGAWLDRVRPLLGTGENAELEAVALASAWRAVAARDSSGGVAELGRAITLLEARTGQSPSAAVIDELARAYAMAGRMDAALSALEAGTSAHADSCQLWMTTAEVAMAGDLPRAVNAAKKATSLCGDSDWRPWSLLGRAIVRQAQATPGATPQSRRERFKAAAEAYSSALRLSPANTAIRLALGQCLDVAEDRGAARTVYESLLRDGGLSAEDLALAQNNLAYCLSKSNPSRAELDRARTLAMAASSSFQVASYFDTLGEIEAARGERSAAIRAYRSALRLDVRAVRPAVGLAELLAQGSGQDREEARQIISELLQRTELEEVILARAQAVQKRVSADASP